MPDTPTISRATPDGSTRALLDEIARMVAEADRDKAAAETKRKQAKECFFKELSPFCEDWYSALYCVDAGPYQGYRLMRTVSYAREVGVATLAAKLPLKVLLTLVKVDLAALDAAVAEGKVPAALAIAATGYKAEPESRLTLNKPTASTKIIVPEGEIAYWLGGSAT